MMLILTGSSDRSHTLRILTPGGISFSFHAEVEADGRLMIPGPDRRFRSETGASADVTMYVRAPGETEFTELSPSSAEIMIGEYTELKLCVTNTGAGSFRLGRMTPVHTEDLRLADLPAEDWFFFRQGRHKNDLPSLTRLGDRGTAFADACSSLLESGGGVDSDASGSVIIGDSLAFFSAGEASEIPLNLMFSFETGDRLFTEYRLRLTDDREFVSFDASSDAGIRLDPGASIESEVLRISVPEDISAAVDGFAARKAALYRVGSRPAPLAERRIPSVYCTWYYYGLTVTEEDVLENLHAITDRRIPFDVYQIDEGWEKVLGDWYPKPGFPSGMQAMAEEIVKAGMIPGIWTSPFIAHETTPVVKEHPEWFLTYADGSPCLFPMNKTVYRVLDITRPEAVDWAASLYTRLRGMGYRYHKLDFTRAAVIYPDAVRFRPDIPLPQAYRAAVSVLRREMGEDAYFLMCGGLYDPLIGIVDAQRTGSDVKSMWSRSVGKNERSIPATMKQNLLRYYFGAFWDADPDALMIRRQEEQTKGKLLSLGLLTDTEAETSTLNQFLGCGLFCSTEPMALIEEDRLQLFRHVMPVRQGVCHPRDLFDGGKCPALLDIAYPDYHMVALLNWSDDETIPGAVTLTEKFLGNLAKESDRFVVASFRDGDTSENVPAGATVRFGDIPPHGYGLYKIFPQNIAKPEVIGSDGHFSMGAELDELFLTCSGGNERYLRFVLNNRFPAELHYRIRLPEGLLAALPGKDPQKIADIVVPAVGFTDIKIPVQKE